MYIHIYIMYINICIYITLYIILPDDRESVKL